MSSRPPKWDYDEIILALEIYLRDRRVLEETDPAVIELSSFLNTLPLHPQRGTGNFRSVNAVVLKLANFRALDPTTSSAGMDAGGQRTQKIWDRMSGRPDEVLRLAGAIRSLETSDLAVAVPEDQGVLEGRLLVRRHLQRERDSSMARRKRTRFAAEHGELFCEACGLRPRTVYGDQGDSILECHHVRPLAEGAERVTRLVDLVLLCANCHRMIHAASPWLTPAGLKALIANGRPVIPAGASNPD